jgi:hypothetical protein
MAWQRAGTVTIVKGGVELRDLDVLTQAAEGSET